MQGLNIFVNVIKTVTSVDFTGAKDALFIWMFVWNKAMSWRTKFGDELNFCQAKAVLYPDETQPKIWFDM